MTIKIPLNVENDIVIRIAEGLQENFVKNSYITLQDLKWASAISELLPSEAREKMDRFIGDDSFPRFIITEIDSERDQNDSREDLVAGQPFTQISFIKNPIVYARKIVDRLKQVPHQYRLTAPLPGAFSYYLQSALHSVIQLPSGIIIARGDVLPKPFPVKSPYKFVDDELFHDWFASEQVDRDLRTDQLYFSMPIVGYSVQFSSSVMGRQFEDYLRAFFGACMAVGLMSYGWQGADFKFPYIMIHDEKNKQIIRTESIEEDFIDRRFHCSSEKFYNKNKENLGSSFNNIIDKIGTIFNDNIDCRRLFAACIWFYRAKVNPRPLDALLQATIAIEVMLGDRKAAEGIGLTNLLASRCAYLLGRSSSHRLEVAEKFRRVYDLRSQVVHEGRHALKLSDRETVSIANSLCAAIIFKELGMRAMPLGKG